MDKKIVKIHISLTGFFAGSIVCGQKELKENEQKFHIGGGRWLDNKDLPICARCKELYDNADKAGDIH